MQSLAAILGWAHVTITQAISPIYAKAPISHPVDPESLWYTTVLFGE